MHHILRYILLALIGLYPCAFQAQGFRVSFNGLPAVPDTASRTLYVHLPEHTDSSFHAVLSWEMPDTSVDDAEALWNDSLVHNGSTVYVQHWRNGATFVVQEHTWQVAFTTLPLVSVAYPPDGLAGLYDETEGTFTLIDSRQRTEAQSVFTTPCQVKYRGGTARSFPKKSYTLSLLDEAGAERDATVLGIRADDKWVLDAMAIDFLRMRNRVAFDVWNDMSPLRDADMLRNGSKGYYVEVIINGCYNGLYCLSDKVNRKLLGLKKPQVESDNTVTLRGALYKCISNGTNTSRMYFPTDDSQDYASSEPEDMTWVQGTKWKDWELAYPDDYAVHEAWLPLLRTIRFVEGVTEDPDSVDRHLADYFFVDNMVDYTVFLFALMCNDNMMHNGYLSVKNMTKDDARIWMTLWDLDASLGRDGFASEHFTDRAFSAFILLETRPFRQLFDKQDSDFMQRCAERWFALKDNLFAPDSIMQRIHRYASLLHDSGAWSRESALWDGKIQVPGFPLVRLGDELQKEIARVEEWYRGNHGYVDRIFCNATSIRTPTYQPFTSIYDVHGRAYPGDTRFEQLPRGIYIINGRKYVK